MEQTDSSRRGGRRRKWWKEGEKTSQRTGMNDSWTGTTERGVTAGEGGGMGRGGQKEKNWDNCNKVNNKKLNKELEVEYFG